MRSIAVAAAAFACAILTVGAGAAAWHPESARFVTATTKPSLDTFAQSTALGRTGRTNLEIYRPSGTAEFAQFTIFVPSGFDLGLSRTIGTKVGNLIAWEAAGSAHLGAITVDDPAKHTADSCAPGTHLGVWLLAPAGMSPLPAYIDKTAGTETALGGYKIVICVPSAAMSGLMLDQFDIEPTITNPTTTGFYMWRVFVVPYLGSAPNPGGAYELRSREPLPISLSLHGRYLNGRAVLTGRLTTPGAGTTGVFINLFAGPSVGRLQYTTYMQTRSGGTFKFSRRIRRTTWFGAEVGSVRACQETTVAPAGCTGETMISVDSLSVRVRIRQRH